MKNKDQYGRSVAVCKAGGEDLNKWMVANGYAVAYSEYSKDYEEVSPRVITVRQILNAKYDLKNVSNLFKCTGCSTSLHTLCSYFELSLSVVIPTTGTLDTKANTEQTTT